MVSTNGGTTWTDITAAPLPNRSITGLTVSPTDPTLVYLTVSGYGTGHIFRSTNSGAAWTDISNNLPNIPTNALLIDPLTPTTLYAGTDIGVFRSTDNGGSWTVFNNGLPPVPVLAFSAQAGGLIQAGTYGRGAYELAPTATGTTIQSQVVSYQARESEGIANITLGRSGDVSGTSSVNYQTVNGTAANPASDRQDYTAALGTATFGPTETSKTVTIFITDDRIKENSESFTLQLSSPVGATLGAVQSTNIDIEDNDAVSGLSPVKDPAFDSGFYVRQHYIDFLNREPDTAGLNFWKGQIDQCEDAVLPGGFTDRQNCREVRRVNVSAAFFLSIEFQETGFLIYTMHTAAFASRQNLDIRKFLPDTQQISAGVIVGQPGWEAAIEANKVKFINGFVARPEFVALYPGNMSNLDYVNALNANAAGALTTAERDALVADLNGAVRTRAQVLRAVSENAVFKAAEFRRAFVLMQYFGYLRRSPNALPDSNFDGYNFWLTKLNQFNGNYITSEMVKAFITSIEYTQRFGL